MVLGVALRYVMEALHKPFGSKMYYFGIVALDRYRSRLKEYPRYCQHLMAVPHFNEFPPHLIEVILLVYQLKSDSYQKNDFIGINFIWLCEEQSNNLECSLTCEPGLPDVESV